MRKKNNQPTSPNQAGQEKGNIFDKILKENIRSILQPIAEDLLQTKIKSMRPLPTKMQTTLEIESDDFNLVETVEGEKMILHIEFEISLAKDMIYRVGEYHAVNQRKYQLPIRHFVFYIGEKKKKVRTQLAPNEVYSGFDLISLNEKNPSEYLASDVPELVIFAVLGDYPDERKDEIVRLVIARLQALVEDKRKLHKYLQQLFIFGRIRKLEAVITKNFEEMTSINYDINQDGLYLKGIERGIEKMLKANRFTTEEISKILDVSLDWVEQVRQKISQK